MQGSRARLFLDGAKDGSGRAAVLHDAAVATSVTLQHAVPARALAKSIARMPESLDRPATKAASAIGAALDLLANCESPIR